LLQHSTESCCVSNLKKTTESQQVVVNPNYKVPYRWVGVKLQSLFTDREHELATINRYLKHYSNCPLQITRVKSTETEHLVIKP